MVVSPYIILNFFKFDILDNCRFWFVAVYRRVYYRANYTYTSRFVIYRYLLQFSKHSTKFPLLLFVLRVRAICAQCPKRHSIHICIYISYTIIHTHIIYIIARYRSFAVIYRLRPEQRYHGGCRVENGSHRIDNNNIYYDDETSINTL